MSPFAALLRRDLAAMFGSGARGGAALPVLFFLAVATLYPFAVGSDARLLADTGGGVLLLAALLPIERLVRPDLELGLFDQLALRGVAEEASLAARILAHWLSFGPPLMVAALPGAALMGIEAQTLLNLELGLLVGTPGLAALGVMVAGLTAALRSGAALGGLLAIPLAVPLLIFGAGSLDGNADGALALTGAASLVVLALAPFAAGAAIRAARE